MRQLDTTRLQGQLEFASWGINRQSFTSLGQLKAGLVAAKQYLVTVTTGTFLVADADRRVTSLVDTCAFNHLVAMQAANLSVFCDVLQTGQSSFYKLSTLSVYLNAADLVTRPSQKESPDTRRLGHQLDGTSAPPRQIHLAWPAPRFTNEAEHRTATHLDTGLTIAERFGQMPQRAEKNATAVTAKSHATQTGR